MISQKQPERTENFISMACLERLLSTQFSYLNECFSHETTIMKSKELRKPNRVHPTFVTFISSFFPNKIGGQERSRFYLWEF